MTPVPVSLPLVLQRKHDSTSLMHMLLAKLRMPRKTLLIPKTLVGLVAITLPTINHPVIVPALLGTLLIVMDITFNLPAKVSLLNVVCPPHLIAQPGFNSRLIPISKLM